MSTAVFNQNLAPELKAQTIRDRLRLGRNFFWTAICVGASFLTLIPLFSIIFLVVSNGIGLLTPGVFFELPPAPGQELRNESDRSCQHRPLVILRNINGGQDAQRRCNQYRNPDH